MPFDKDGNWVSIHRTKPKANPTPAPAPSSSAPSSSGNASTPTAAHRSFGLGQTDGPKDARMQSALEQRLNGAISGGNPSGPVKPDLPTFTGPKSTTNAPVKAENLSAMLGIGAPPVKQPDYSKAGLGSADLPKYSMKDGTIPFFDTEASSQWLTKLGLNPNTKPEELNGAQTAVASFAGGVGDTAHTLGWAADWAGLKNLGNDLKATGGDLQERYDIPQQEFKGWKSLLDPKFYETNVARTMPTTLALIPLALLGGEGGAAVAGAAVARTAITPFASALIRSIGAAAGSSLLSTPVESAMEAGGVYEEMRNKGLSPEEADAAADKTFWGNMLTLGISNGAEFASAFLPGGSGKIMRTLSHPITKLVGGALMEGGEEALQEVISRNAKGEKIAWDANMQEQFAVGGLMGAGFGTIGAISEAKTHVENIKKRVVERLPDEMKTDFNEAMQDARTAGIPEKQAVDAALDHIAQTPEGAELISKITDEVVESANHGELAKQAPVLEPQTAEPEVKEGSIDRFKQMMDELERQKTYTPGMKQVDQFLQDNKMVPLEDQLRTQQTAAPAAPTGFEVGHSVNLKGKSGEYTITGFDKKMVVVQGTNGKKLSVSKNSLSPVSVAQPEAAPQTQQMSDDEINNFIDLTYGVERDDNRAEVEQFRRDVVMRGSYTDDDLNRLTQFEQPPAPKTPEVGDVVSLKGMNAAGKTFTVVGHGKKNTVQVRDEEGKERSISEKGIAGYHGKTEVEDPAKAQAQAEFNDMRNQLAGNRWKPATSVKHLQKMKEHAQQHGLDFPDRYEELIGRYTDEAAAEKAQNRKAPDESWTDAALRLNTKELTDELSKLSDKEIRGMLTEHGMKAGKNAVKGVLVNKLAEGLSKSQSAEPTTAETDAPVTEAFEDTTNYPDLTYGYQGPQMRKQAEIDANMTDEEVASGDDDLKKWLRHSARQALAKEKASGGEQVDETQYNEALQHVKESGSASIALLQQKMKLSYTDLAKLVDKMEERGEVGANDGKNPREILKPTPKAEETSAAEVPTSVTDKQQTVIDAISNGEKITAASKKLSAYQYGEGTTIESIHRDPKTGNVLVGLRFPYGNGNATAGHDRVISPDGVMDDFAPGKDTSAFTEVVVAKKGTAAEAPKTEGTKPTEQPKAKKEKNKPEPADISHITDGDVITLKGKNGKPYHVVSLDQRTGKLTVYNPRYKEEGTDNQFKVDGSSVESRIEQPPLEVGEPKSIGYVPGIEKGDHQNRPTMVNHLNRTLWSGTNFQATHGDEQRHPVTWAEEFGAGGGRNGYAWRKADGSMGVVKEADNVTNPVGNIPPKKPDAPTPESAKQTAAGETFRATKQSEGGVSQRVAIKDGQVTVTAAAKDFKHELQPSGLDAKSMTMLSHKFSVDDYLKAEKSSGNPHYGIKKFMEKQVNIDAVREKHDYSPKVDNYIDDQIRAVDEAFAKAGIETQRAAEKSTKAAPKKQPLEAPQAAPAATSGEVEVGDTITLKGRKTKFAVTSISKKGMLGLKSEYGAETSVHKKAVDTVSKEPMQAAPAKTISQIVEESKTTVAETTKEEPNLPATPDDEPPKGPASKSAFDAHRAKVKAAAEAAAKRAHSHFSGNQLNSGLPPRLFADMIVIGYDKMLDGFVALKDWSAEIKKQFPYDGLDDFLDMIHFKAKQISELPEDEQWPTVERMLKTAYGDMPEDHVAAVEQAEEAPKDSKQDIAEWFDNLGESEKPEKIEGIHRLEIGMKVKIHVLALKKTVTDIVDDIKPSENAGGHPLGAGANVHLKKADMWVGAVNIQEVVSYPETAAEPEASKGPTHTITLDQVGKDIQSLEYPTVESWIKANATNIPREKLEWAWEEYYPQKGDTVIAKVGDNHKVGTFLGTKQDKDGLLALVKVGKKEVTYSPDDITRLEVSKERQKNRNELTFSELKPGMRTIVRRTGYIIGHPNQVTELFTVIDHIDNGKVYSDYGQTGVRYLGDRETAYYTAEMDSASTGGFKVGDNVAFYDQQFYDNGSYQQRGTVQAVNEDGVTVKHSSGKVIDIPFSNRTLFRNDKNVQHGSTIRWTDKKGTHTGIVGDASINQHYQGAYVSAYVNGAKTAKERYTIVKYDDLTVIGNYQFPMDFTGGSIYRTGDIVRIKDEKGKFLDGTFEIIAYSKQSGNFGVNPTEWREEIPTNPNLLIWPKPENLVLVKRLDGSFQNTVSGKGETNDTTEANRTDDSQDVEGEQTRNVPQGADDRSDSGTAESGGGSSDRTGGSSSETESTSERSDEGGSGTGLDQENGAGDRDEGVSRTPDGQRGAEPGIKSPDFVLTNELDELGGVKTKFRNNVKAIQLLRELEFSGRNASPSEQAVLAKYVGWGALAHAFDKAKVGTEEYDAMRKLVDDDIISENEYAEMRKSTQYAHYTSEEVVTAMYDALRRMGFTGGRVLEPAMGSGNFFGFMPGDMTAASKRTGIERDTITGGIAKLLYPNANIHVKGFQDYTIADGHFDVAIGNPPYGGKISDPKYPAGVTARMHNYFFVKSLDKVRDGGLLLYVTSSGTMNSTGNDSARMEMARRADFVGAIRLPGNAFKKNAGTEVTTDIIVFRKRAKGEAPNHADDGSFLEMATVYGKNRKGEQVALQTNAYFDNYPEMVLGETVEDTLHPGRLGVKADDRDFKDALNKAVSALPENIYKPRGKSSEAFTNEQLQQEKSNGWNGVDDGGFFIENGKVMQREGDSGVVTKLSPENEKRVRALIPLRDTVRTLLRDMRNADVTDEQIDKQRGNLNRIYDKFVKEYGPLNRDENRKLMMTDPIGSGVMFAIEQYEYEKNGRKITNEKAEKGAIFEKRTIRPSKPVSSVATAEEALVLSLFEKGKLDFAYMSDLTGKGKDVLVDKLGERIFQNPEYGDDSHYETADEYLSGNVRKKLEAAKKATEGGDTRYERNIAALEKVQPRDLVSSEIKVKIGSRWVPPTDYEGFIHNVLGLQDKVEVKYDRFLAKWSIAEINERRTPLFSSIRNTDEYGVRGAGRKDYTMIDILTDTLNLQTAKVTYTVKDDQDRTITVNDEQRTAQAKNIQNQLQMMFEDWLWSEDERSSRLLNHYNWTFNNHRLRTYDGELVYGGKDNAVAIPGFNNSKYALRKWQKDAIWRGLQGKNTLYAHVVGAGKTLEQIVTMMEMRRLGIANKPLLITKNKLVPQMYGDIFDAYPGAKVLRLTSDDLPDVKVSASAKDPKAKQEEMRLGRAAMLSKIATGDYDIILMSHDLFSRLPVSPERKQAHIQQQIEDVREALEGARADGTDDRTIKQLEGTLENLESDLSDDLDDDRKAMVIPFEELGIDYLFVDESQEFKNLPFHSKLNIKGLKFKGAKRAQDLFMKTQWFSEMRGGGGVVFATGTPIKNTMGEMFNLQRYLNYAGLDEQGNTHFDSWAAMFAKVTSDFEVTASGQFKETERLAAFDNVPELLTDFFSFADVKIASMLDLPKPKRAHRHIVKVPLSEGQQDYIDLLVSRAEAMSTGRFDSKIDNYLKLTTDGKKMAVDLRLVVPSAGDDPNSKLNAVVNNVVATYKRRDFVDKEGNPIHNHAQVVFLDLGVPKTENQLKKEKEKKTGKRAASDDIFADDEGGVEEDFTQLYADLKQKMVRKGIPIEKIAFVHDAKDDAALEKLYKNVREGNIQVLIGNTSRMGAGVNVQKRLVALHHVDPTWNPADIEQREGRIDRQGNLFDDIHIYSYVTEGSFDALMWDLLRVKAQFIQQMMSGKLDVRTVEDIGDVVLNFASVAGEALGTTVFKDKQVVDKKVTELLALKTGFERTNRTNVDKIKNGKQLIDINKRELAQINYDIPNVIDISGDKFTVTFGGQTFTNRKEAGEKLLELHDDLYPKLQEGQSRTIGKLGAFNVLVQNKPAKSPLALEGRFYNYDFQPTETGVGTIGRMENAMQGIPRLAEYKQERIDKITAGVEDLQRLGDRKFDREEELAQLTAKQAELAQEVTQLNEVAKTRSRERREAKVARQQMAAGNHKGDTAEDQAAYDVNVQKDNQGMGIVPPGFARFQQPPKRKSVEEFAVPDPDIEDRFQAAEGKPKEGLLHRIAEGFHKALSYLREFEYLPKTPEYEVLRQKLLQLVNQESAAKFRGYQIILHSITLNLSKRDYRLFRRKVILDDMYQEYLKGNALAFGFNDKLDVFLAYKEQIDESVGLNDAVKKALEKRKKAWDDIKDKYFDAMGDIGHNVEDKLTREDYYRHQVLETVKQIRTGEGVRKLRTPNRRGFLKGRSGTYEGDYNTDYLQAEAEVMIQMLYDIEKAKVIKVVDDRYNIAPKLKAEAKAQGVFWKDLIKPTHRIWQPREGSIFYRKDDAAIANDLFATIMGTIGVDQAIIDQTTDAINQAIGKPVLVVGAKRREFVLPVEVADTLDNLGQNAVDKVKILKMEKKAMRQVKRWMLLGPHNFLKYQLRNFSSDMERTVAGNPMALRYMMKAGRELGAVYFKESAGSKELREYIKRGGLENIMGMQELGDSPDMRAFNRFYDKKDFNLAAKAWSWYWKKATSTNGWREGILRYAHYLEYLDQMKKNPNQLPRNYGASDRERLAALPDIRDRAMKLSNELIGDYTATSVIGQELSDTGIYPFFRWVEVNAKSTTMLLKNAHQDGTGKLAGTIGMKLLGKVAFRTPYYAYRAARLTLGMSVIAALLLAWNNLKWPEEEENLPEDVRNRMHLIYGRDKNGKTLYLDRLGFIEDYFEWFGMDDLGADFRDILNGHKTIQETIEADWHKPINKAVQGAGPFIKAPIEAVTGMQLFPDAFNPTRNHAMIDPLVNMLGVSKEYAAVKRSFNGVPGKPIEISKFFALASDPGEAAYYETMDMVGRFKKRHNIASGEAGERTDRSNALYNYKQAMRYGDDIAMEKFITKYIMLGGTKDGIITSIKALNPIYGLSDQNKKLFYVELNGNDRKVFDRAMIFYTGALLGPQE